MPKAAAYTLAWSAVRQAYIWYDHHAELNLTLAVGSPAWREWLEQTASFVFRGQSGVYYVSRYFATGNHPENIPWFDSLWQYRQFRHTMRVITVVWGIGFLIEAAVRTFLVIVLSTEQFLIVSPFVLYGIIGVLVIWMFLYSRQGRKKGEEIRQRMQAEQRASS